MQLLALEIIMSCHVCDGAERHGVGAVKFPGELAQ